MWFRKFKNLLSALLCRRVKSVEEKMFKRVDSEASEPTIKDEAKMEMKEIVFDATKHMVSSDKFSLKDFMDTLLGKAKDEVKKILDDAANNKLISESRMVPIGAVVTQDYRPGRVTVTFDASGKAVDAQQG